MATQEPAKIVLDKVCPSCSRTFASDSRLSNCPHDQTILTVSPNNPIIGITLSDHYEVLEQIGEGAWSTVYKAKHQQINRFVAVKVMHAHLITDSEKVLRFQREAEAASKLMHPGIATIFDFGTLESGQPFIVMEFLDGKPLSELLDKEGPISLQRTVKLVIELCQGLAMAHEKGIIHRDIKPSNIFICRTGQEESAKLLDFGLAKVLDPENPQGNLTKTGDTLGTPDYMSPEQCLGMPIDVRSDIYTMGYVIYEMLTGKQAVDGCSSYDSMNKHINEYPPPLHEVNPGLKVPLAVENVIYKCIAKAPEKRYSSIQEVIEALNKAYKEPVKNHFVLNLFRRRQPRSSIVKTSRAYMDPAIILAAALTGLLLLVCVCYLKNTLTASKTGKTQGAIATRIPGESYHDAWQDLETQGVASKQNGNYAGAIKPLESAFEQAKLIGEDSSEYEETLNQLEDAYQHLGKTDQVQRIKAIRTAHNKENELNTLGTLETNAKKIIELSSDLSDNPGNKKTASELIHVLNCQSILSTVHGQYDDAETYIKRAQKLALKYVGENSVLYAKALSNEAYYLAETGTSSRAGDLWQKSLDIRRKLLKPDDPDLGRAIRNFAQYQAKQGKFASAEKLLNEALEIYTKSEGIGSEDYAWTAGELGIAYMEQGNYPTAEKWLSTAYDIRKKLYGDQGLETARSLANLGQLHRLRHQNDKSVEEFSRSLAVLERILGPSDKNVGACCFQLGLAYKNAGDNEKAEQFLTRGLSISKQVAPESQLCIDCFEALCELYKSEGEIDKGIQLTKSMNVLATHKK